MGVETELAPLKAERRGSHPVVVVLGSLVLGSLLSGAVNGAAFAALYVTGAPMPVSLVLEPLSLLLLPSAVMMTSVNGGDVEGGEILWASLGLYAVFFFALLCWLRLRRRA